MNGAAESRETAGLTGRGWRRFALLGLLALLSLPSSAAAQEVFTTGDWLTPVAPPTAQRGMSALSLEARSGSFECTPAWAPVGATPSGLVIGNCRGPVYPYAGWHLHRTVFDVAAGNNWDGGEVLGDFNGCGWINNQNDAMKATGSFATCSTASRPTSDYIFWSAEYDYWIWSNAEGNDGMSYNNPHDCPEYANYRPWTSGNVETNYLRTAPATPSPAAPILKIRYNTKYPSADGSGYYIMARDTTVGSGDGNWVFIPASCINP